MRELCSTLLNSHAAYLGLGQHGILHKIGQHLQCSLLRGLQHQMHSVDQPERNLASSLTRLQPSSLDPRVRVKKCKERDLQVLTQSLGDRLTVT